MLQYKEPWGFSKLQTYQDCPQQFKFRYIDKLRETESEALKRGSRIHDALQHYLNGWKDTLPQDIDLGFWKMRLLELRDRKPQTEAAWGVDKNWTPLDNWLHPNTWIRAKSDVFKVNGLKLELIDFKTGKYREPSPQQIELYAIIGHCFFPQVTQVEAAFWFLDQPEPPLIYKYAPSTLLKLRKVYANKAAPIYKDKTFRPTPGSYCKFCPFSRQRGGKCEY